MSRFFLTEQDSLDGQEIILRGENFHHLSRVLRTRVGEAVEVCDGKGTDYYCVAREFDKESATLLIERTSSSVTEEGPFITLYQCIAKGDKMEQIITRCTEMGVSRFVPVLSRYCVARPEGNKKIERWQKVALAAAKQSGRGLVPEVKPIMDITDAIEEMSGAELAFVCYEGETRRSAAELPVAREIAFLIGSEGGLSEQERALWESKGIPAITLGKRILRTENAAAYVVPILFYKLQTEVKNNG